MKKLIAFLFVLTFSGFCFAQNSPGSNTEPVSVIWVGYVRSTENPDLQRVYDKVPYVVGVTNNTSRNASHDIPAPADSRKYNRQLVLIKPGSIQNRTSVQFRNKTQKKVTAVEYNFIVQNKKGKELKRYKFVNNSDIQPNETETFSNVVGSHSDSLIYKAEIIRVTYKDGSVWVP